MKVETFDKVNITTKLPSLSLKVTRVKGEMISYLISNDNSYPLNSAILVAMVNGSEYTRKEISINGNTTGSISIPGLLSGDLVEIKITDVKASNMIIKGLNASDKFRY